MTDIAQLFDGYSRQARLYPALLTILPGLVFVLATFPQLMSDGIGTTLLTIAAATGILFLMADTARSLGKRLEPRLLQAWGGWPTTIWLRHSTSYLTPDTKTRYHNFLSVRLPDLSFPTREVELRDPASADAIYVSATEWLKEQCRGKAFPLIGKENAIYGFRRNLLGLKPLGLGIAILSMIASVTTLAMIWDGKWTVGGTLQLIRSHPVQLGTFLFALLTAFCWVFMVKKSWVRAAGDGYARALLASCDSL